MCHTYFRSLLCYSPLRYTVLLRGDANSPVAGRVRAGSGHAARLSSCTEREERPDCSASACARCRNMRPNGPRSRPARCLGRGTRPARIPRAKDEPGSPYAISACGVVGARRATCASQPRLAKLKASCWSHYAEWAAVCPVTVTPVSWKAQRERYQRTRSRRPTATR